MHIACASASQRKQNFSCHFKKPPKGVLTIYPMPPIRLRRVAFFWVPLYG